MNSTLAEKIKQAQALQKELIKQKIYPCKVCGKTYKREKALIKHNIKCVAVVEAVSKPNLPKKLAVYKTKIVMTQYNKHKVDWIHRKINFTNDTYKKAIYVNALTKYEIPEDYFKLQY